MKSLPTRRKHLNQNNLDRSSHPQLPGHGSQIQGRGRYVHRDPVCPQPQPQSLMVGLTFPPEVASSSQFTLTQTQFIIFLQNALLT